ncbi:Transmembrane nucleoporin [Purpureocillium takamizusanense]|uniref:Transmembrane nucleoporin n=1 Tax=Purpureocillium takamizusanense TaxID=2060973 RepID=A0A9Q8V9M0_9HYPO|nr:Transmembrane nucleoporin [Purpureocillium takamizusanense]UNI16836.1 Transmembrane nucleoporin [Purpureocillium takamizusanense]
MAWIHGMGQPDLAYLPAPACRLGTEVSLQVREQAAPVPPPPTYLTHPPPLTVSNPVDQGPSSSIRLSPLLPTCGLQTSPLSRCWPLFPTPTFHLITTTATTTSSSQQQLLRSIAVNKLGASAHLSSALSHFSIAHFAASAETDPKPSCGHCFRPFETASQAPAQRSSRHPPRVSSPRHRRHRYCPRLLRARTRTRKHSEAMAPPPNSNLPLQERLLALARTLQFAWFVGHLTLILSTIRYAFSWLRMNYYGGVAQFSYRTSFVAAAVTYGIVVYKTQRARAKSGSKMPGGIVGLLSDENVQYLLMALVWLFSPQYPIALLPYSVYSVFHVATYTRANLLPVLQPPPPAADGSSPRVKTSSPLAERIGNFVKEYYDASMSIVSALEILIWIRVLLSAVLFQRRSWILLALYTAFLRARFAQSSHVQNSVTQLGARVDSLVGAQGTPPAARQVWDGVKSGARQFHDATELGKYVNTAGPAKKTS